MTTTRALLMFHYFVLSFTFVMLVACGCLVALATVNGKPYRFRFAIAVVGGVVGMAALATALSPR
jgi:hypothetical protein